MTPPTPTVLPEALRLADVYAEAPPVGTICWLPFYEFNNCFEWSGIPDSFQEQWLKEGKVFRTEAAALAALRTNKAAPTTEQSSEVAQAGAPADMEDEQCRCEPSEWVPPRGYDGDGSVAAMARRATQPQAGAESYPPMTNLEHTVRRIRRCENEAAAMVVFGYALRQFADATAALRARGAVPSGWKLVPMEPTGVMKDCGAGSLPVAASRPWAAGDCYRAMLAAAPQPPAALPGEQDAALDAHQANGLAWAVHRWESEVKDRPMVNVHRRSLDDAWRQVVRYFGGDPDKLLGQSHDAALAAKGRTAGGAA